MGRWGDGVLGFSGFGVLVETSLFPHSPIPHSLSPVPRSLNLIGYSENFDTGFGDGDGVFKLGRKFTIFSNSSPTVF